MSFKTRQFVNEIGNRIQISLEQRDISGVNGVVISLSGPDSDTQSHVTLLEAQVLHEELSKFLKRKFR